MGRIVWEGQQVNWRERALSGSDRVFPSIFLVSRKKEKRGLWCKHHWKLTAKVSERRSSGATQIKFIQQALASARLKASKILRTIISEKREPNSPMESGLKKTTTNLEGFPLQIKEPSAGGMSKENELPGRSNYAVRPQEPHGAAHMCWTVRNLQLSRKNRTEPFSDQSQFRLRQGWT